MLYDVKKKREREKVEGGWPGAEGGEMEVLLNELNSALQCENFEIIQKKCKYTQYYTELYTLNG